MIYLGSDHAGFELKQAVKGWLESIEEPYEDKGNAVLDPADDYPDFGFAVAEAVRDDFGGKGILVCGSAQGVCIAANKVAGVRAVAARTAEEARLAREHNNANVLCLSGWKQSLEDAKPVIEAFLRTPFSDEERHHRRVDKITNYEEAHFS